MNCDKCKKKNATIHLMEIIGNEKREVNLCPECAAAQGVHIPAPTGIDVLSGIVSQHVGKELAAMAGLVCPDCGHTYLAFRTQGRLGCPKDYEVFAKGLTPLIERMHGAREHVGKVPASAGRHARTTSELARLRRLLKQAVDQENFERAAELRDEIQRKGGGKEKA